MPYQPPKTPLAALAFLVALSAANMAPANSIVESVNATLEPAQPTSGGVLREEKYRCLAEERYLIDTMPVSIEKRGLVKFTDDTGNAVVDLINLVIRSDGLILLTITVKGTGLSQSFEFAPLKKNLADWDTWGHKDGVVGTYLYRNPDSPREFRMLTRTLVINPEYMADSILKFRCY